MDRNIITLNARQSPTAKDYWIFEAECRFEDEDGILWNSMAYMNYQKKAVFNTPSLGRAEFGELFTLAGGAVKAMEDKLGER